MWENISDSDEPKISHDLGGCGMTSCDFGGTDIKDIGVEQFLNEPGSVKILNNHYSQQEADCNVGLWHL